METNNTYYRIEGCCTFSASEYFDMKQVERGGKWELYRRGSSVLISKHPTFGEANRHAEDLGLSPEALKARLTK